MRTNKPFRKTLIAAGLMTAFSLAPFAPVAAQNAVAQPQAQDAATPPPTQDASAQDKPSTDRTVPGKADDAWITTKVKTELATSRSIKSGDMAVSTKDGVVSLTGTASSVAEKIKIAQITREVKGVKSVDTSGLAVSDTAK
ncbi:hypothetical protein HY57_07835 [Dyella japonica A8]|uniref:BON domain-containing protein n=2 Tax=Dyella japonica TaxID=231455 RepID=A0A075JYN8_9GAMM|nr:hypothetical protein HY57_07835 [Dyella japonica A8]